jgi:formylglycine-generating enzyme required for sulfatase activity
MNMKSQLKRCLYSIITVGLMAVVANAQQNTWTMNGNLSDSATNDTSNPDLAFDVSAYGGTNGFGAPDYVHPSPDTSNPITILLNTALRLHEDDATGRLQRVRVSSSVLGTSPGYRSDWTLALWFNRFNHTSTDWLVYAGNLYGAAGTSSEFEVVGNLDGTVQARCWNNATNEMDITSTPLSSQQWHHVAFVFANNNSGILYVDGQLVGVDVSVNPDPAFNAQSNLFFGGIRAPQEGSHYTRALDGYLDHIQVFSNALSSQEVLNLYNRGRVLPQLVSVTADEFDIRMAFAPFAGAGYALQYATSVDGPWLDMLTPAQGAVADSQMMSAINAPTQRFYRLTTTTNQALPGMVWIEGGDVELGQVGIAEPVRTNYISSFWMEATEVTKAKWDEVYSWALTNGYAFDNTGFGKSNNHPVVRVNWYDCVKWCNARSQKEGLAPCYTIDPIFFNPYKTGTLDISNSWVNWSANGYRLPTDAEWEKASRGGWQGRTFPWGGEDIQHSRANYLSTNSYPYDTSPTRGYHPAFTLPGPATLPVGSFNANGYGLHDMAGNAVEWCWDWHGTYSEAYQSNPRGPDTGGARTRRGSSWGHFASAARCATRDGYAPINQSDATGLRCVRHPQP